MAASTEQKVDFLLKKIGYSLSKTGRAEDDNVTWDGGSGSNTKKKPFAESIPSPIIVPSTSLWADSSLIPSTPPTASAHPVGIHTVGNPYRLTHDATVGINTRTFIARSTHGDQTSSIEGNWIDAQFGAEYAVRVFKDDATVPANELSQAGASASETWFFDYSSGILNFNGSTLPSGIGTNNVYLVGYRYTGGTGAKPPIGIGTFDSLNVTGIATFHKDVEFIGAGDAGIKSTFWDQSASSLKFLDGVKAEFGDSQDLQLYHLSGNSYVKNTTAGSLLIQGDTIDLRPGSGDTGEVMLRAVRNAQVEIRHDNVPKLVTTGYGVTVTGLESIGISTLTGDVRAGANLSVAGLSTFQDDVTFTGSAGYDTQWDKSANTLKFHNNHYASFGVGDKLTIRHTGTNGYIQYNSGSLFITPATTNTANYLQIDGGAELYLKHRFSNGGQAFALKSVRSGGVELYHSGNKKFATSGIGVTIYDQLDVGNIGISTGLIQGPATMYIDPATVGDNTGLLVVKGNLQVDGTQTTVNSATMTVTDKNILLAKGAANDAAANTGGITVSSGQGDKTWQWLDGNDSWSSSEHIRVADDKVYGWVDDTNSYIGRPAADTIAFTHGGSERVRITSSQTRIGSQAATDTTSYEIQLSGATNNDSILSLYNPTSNNGEGINQGFFFKNSNNTVTEFARITSTAIETTAATVKGDLRFYTTNGDDPVNLQEKLRITGIGSVGIGTDDPVQKLEVYGGHLLVRNLTDDAAKIILRDDSGSYNHYQIRNEDGTFKIRNSGASPQYDAISVLSTGNIGINSTTPTTTLDVRGTVQVSGISTFADVITASQGIKVNADGSNSANYVSVGESDDLKLYHSTGGNSIIRNSTGYLELSANAATWIKTTEFNIIDNDATHYHIRTFKNNRVELYFNNQLRLETLQRGVGIGGSIHIDNDAYVTGITTTVQLKVGANPTVGITTILDEDNMASDSATALATQQSIKKYIDDRNPAGPGGGALSVSADSGSNETINLNSEVLDIEGTANEIETATGTNKVVIGLPNNVTIGNNLTVTNDVGVIGIGTFGEGIEIKNDTYKLRAGQDLEMQVFHDGTNSIIKDTRNDGKVRIQADNFDVRDKDDGKTMIAAGVDGSVSLSHSGNQKFQTLERGVSIGGSITVSNDLSVSGVSTFNSNVNVNADITANSLTLDDDGTGNNILTVKSDDENPYGFVLINDTYKSSAPTGYKLSQFNSGEIEVLLRANTSATRLPYKIRQGNAPSGIWDSFTINADGAVGLAYGGNQKLSTTGYGVSVSGFESIGIATFHSNVDVNASADISGNLVVGAAGTTITTTVGAAASVGIGTANPAYMLDVAGAINSSTDVKINGTSVLTSALDEAVAMAIALG